MISLHQVWAPEKANCYIVILLREPQEARLTFQEPHREVMQRQVCASRHAALQMEQRNPPEKPSFTFLSRKVGCIFKFSSCSQAPSQVRASLLAAHAHVRQQELWPVDLNAARTLSLPSIPIFTRRTVISPLWQGNLQSSSRPAAHLLLDEPIELQRPPAQGGPVPSCGHCS